MKRYWWVNHKQTVSQEIAGGFLWSPKTTKTGTKNKFYDNMRVASPGDFVLSFANSRISYLGYVSDFALTAAKPPEFGAAGDSWGIDGWLLPVAWSTLHLPVRPKHFIEQIAALLPTKYSPIKAATGNGNQGAYLAEISFELFQAVLAKTGIDLDLAFSNVELAASFGDYAQQLDDAVERQLSISTALSATEKTQIIKARRGQGLFRANVQLHEQSCRLTGVTSPYLLVASHIKPWRVCQTSNERLDGNNGLLLTPHVDLLFDRGFISFKNNGELLTSSQVNPEDLHRLGIGAPFIPRAFSAEQRGYLSYHRANVFVV